MRATITVVVICLFALSLAHSQQTVTKATVDQWMEELSNWDRWGKQDQLGAINLITPAKRKQAVAL
ncbi:MAG: cyclase family protein, partial [bacterium]|nr:cyclase family protein [bacterium]